MLLQCKVACERVASVCCLPFSEKKKKKACCLPLLGAMLIDFHVFFFGGSKQCFLVMTMVQVLESEPVGSLQY